MARHRGPFWAGVLLCLALVVAGGAVALSAYRHADGPGGAVLGYLRAIARGDAAAALGYGTVAGSTVPGGAVPAGATPYLTDTVLRRQAAIAPLRDVEVTRVARHGHSAEVGYAYRLDFAAGARQVRGSVRVTDHGGRWLLGAVAARVGLTLGQARDRATLAGAPLPAGPVWLFPGAIPVRFDPADLDLAPASDEVRLGDTGTIALRAQVTPAARTRLAVQLTAMLHTCVTSASLDRTAGCPLPDDRYVPGSLRGTIATSSLARLGYPVATDPAGRIAVDGDVSFRGSYAMVGFDGIVRRRAGTLSIPVRAQTYLSKDIQLRWVNRP